MIRSATRFFCLNVVLPIFLGGLIYTLFRGKNILLFKWYEDVGIFEIIMQIRIYFNPNDMVVSNFLTQNLPDGLWVFSFTSCLLLIWERSASKQKKIYFFIPIFLSILSEFLQLLNIVNGTFDWWDILFYIFFTYLATKIYNKCYEQKKFS